MREWLSDLDKSTFARVRDSIRMGYIEGRTTGQMIRDLRGTAKLGFKDGIFEINRRHAETIVRTAINHTANSARDKLFSANKDIVKEVQWVSTLDGRTSAICQSRDGQTWPVDQGPRPPAHPNAVAGGTMITTPEGQKTIEDIRVGDLVLTHMGRYCRVYTVMCKPCDGKMLDLVCDTGARLSLTDDHPILAKGAGWVNADALKAGHILFENTDQFSDLPCSVGSASEVAQAVLIDAHNMETEVSEELISYGVFSHAVGMSSAVNLKQHIAEFEVGDVSVNGHLKLEGNTEAIEYVDQPGFMPRRGAFQRLSQGSADFDAGVIIKRWVAFFHAFGRFCFDLLKKLWLGAAPMVFAGRVINEFGVSSNGVLAGSNENAVSLAHVEQRSFAKSKFAFYAPDRFAALPMFGLNKFRKFVFCHGSSYRKWIAATIILVVERESNDIVYNLAVEDDETYVANGIVVHNCRSSMSPVVKSWQGMNQTGLDAETRASMNGQVPANQTYGAWLKKQPSAFQDDILGKTKGKLFRKGGVSVDRFVDYQGHEYTIKELRRREASAFTAAGL